MFGAQLASVDVAIILLMIGMLFDVFLEKTKYAKITAIVSSIILGIVAVNIWFGFISVVNVDYFTKYFIMIFASVSILAILIAYHDYQSIKRIGIVFALILASNIGMLIAVSSTNLISIFIGWKLGSFAIIMMIALKRTPRSIEASLKFFIMEVIGIALFAVGMAFVYGSTGAFDLTAIASASQSDNLIYFGITMMIVGLAFEMAIIPFHVWIPDTYSGATISSVVYISGVLKAMAFAIAIRIFYIGFMKISWYWSALFAVLAIITMTLGNLVALVQKTMRRLLAWSSIAHAGYIIIVLAAVGESIMLLVGGLIHIFMHSFMKTLAFSATGIIEENFGNDLLDNFNGLARSNGIIAFALAVDMFSLAGIPPLGGFWSKWFLFWGAVENGYMWLALIGAINSAISLYYYALVVKRMYVENNEKSVRIKVAPQYFIPIIISLLIITAVLYLPTMYGFLEQISF